MPPRELWQHIPSDVLDDQRRAEAASSWAASQRASVVADWAAMHEQDARSLLERYGVPYPGALPPDGMTMPVGGSVEPATTRHDAQQPSIQANPPTQTTRTPMGVSAPDSGQFQGQGAPMPRYLGPAATATGPITSADAAPGVVSSRPTPGAVLEGARAGVPEALGEAGRGVNAAGVGLQEAVRTVPGGSAAVDWLQERGRINLEDIRLMSTPDEVLSPEEIERKQEALLNIAMMSGSLGPASRYEPDPKDFAAFMQSRQGVPGRRDIEGNVLPKSGSFKVDTTKHAEEAYYAGKQAVDEGGLLPGSEAEALRTAAESPLSAGGAPRPPGLPPAPPIQAPPPGGMPPPPPRPPPGPPRQPGPTGELGRLRLDKFPEAVRDTIREAAESGDFWRTQRRGVIPDAEAERMADDLGRTVDQVISGGKTGKAYNTEETRAIRNALVAQSVKVNEIAQQIAANPMVRDERLVAEQIAEGMKLADLSRVAEGGRAEAGRALRAYQTFARDFAADPAEAVQRVYRANGLDAEQAAAAVNSFTKMTREGADPFQMASFWSRVEKPPPGAQDWFELVRYNAMLSGPRTIAINVIGNSLEIPWRLSRDFGASLARGRPEEVLPEIAGVWAGLRRGLEPAMQTLAHGISEADAASGAIPRSVSARIRGEGVGPTLQRATATALEIPLRAAQASDVVAKSIAYAMASGRYAGIEASKAGLRPGRAWAAKVAEAWDTMPAEAIKGAGEIADRMTYKGETGLTGQKLEGLQSIPWVGRVVMPFLRTVYHITARGVDRSPLGAVGTTVDVLRGKYGRGADLRAALSATKGPSAGVAPLGERIGDNVMGTVAGFWLYNQALEGNVTGSGPDDPEKRRMWEAEGHQQFSFKVGDRYVSYSNLGPMAVPMSLAAALAEAQLYAKPEAETPELAADTFRRFAEVFSDQPYLQGYGAIYKGMRDPGTYGLQWLTQFTQSLVPFGAAINTAGQALDPVQRQPEKGNIPQALQARVPETPFTPGRQSLPERQDVLGRGVPSEQTGFGALNPLRTRREAPDTVLRALSRHQIDVPEPPKTVTLGKVKDIPLTQAEQQTHRRLVGDELSRVVRSRLDSEAFRTDTAEGRVKRLQKDLDAARAKATRAVLDAMSDEELDRRAGRVAEKRERVLAGITP